MGTDVLGPVILMLTAVSVQYLLGYGLIPRHGGFRFVSRTKHPAGFRLCLHVWLAVLAIYVFAFYLLK